jgi:hypothetical protein
MAQEVLDSAEELKSLEKWQKSDGKKMLQKELWNVNSRF